MNQLSKLGLVAATAIYGIYTILQWLLQWLGISELILLFNFLFIAICSIMLLNVYQKANILRGMFSGLHISIADKKPWVRLDITRCMTQKVSSIWYTIPALIFGQRTYQRDEVMGAYMFISLVALGFIFLFRILFHY